MISARVSGSTTSLASRTVYLEEISHLGFDCAVKQVPNVKTLHRFSSLSKSSRLVGVVVDFDGRPRNLVAERAGGIAWVRARDVERTAENRREDSRMLQRCVKSSRSAEEATFKPTTNRSSALSTGVSSSALGEAARYWVADEQRQPRHRTANVITKSVPLAPSYFHMDQDEVIQGGSPFSLSWSTFHAP